MLAILIIIDFLKTSVIICAYIYIFIEKCLERKGLHTPGKLYVSILYLLSFQGLSAPLAECFFPSVHLRFLELSHCLHGLLEEHSYSFIYMEVKGLKA